MKWLLLLISMSVSAQELPSVQGKFVQTRDTPGMDAPLKSDGKFLFAQATGLLWAIDDGSTAMFIPAEGKTRMWRGDQWQTPNSPAMKYTQQFIRAIAQQNQAELDKNFQQKKLTGEDGANVTRLSPRRSRIKRFISYIDVRRDTYLRSIRIQQQDGAALQLDFLDQQPLAALNADSCENVLNRSACQQVFSP